MHLQPVQTTLTECLPYGELQQSTGDVISHVIQVWWDWVQPTSEVEVVWEVDAIDT